MKTIKKLFLWTGIFTLFGAIFSILFTFIFKDKFIELVAAYLQDETLIALLQELYKSPDIHFYIETAGLIIAGSLYLATFWAKDQNILKNRVLLTILSIVYLYTGGSIVTVILLIIAIIKLFDESKKLQTNNVDNIENDKNAEEDIINSTNKDIKTNDTTKKEIEILKRKKENGEISEEEYQTMLKKLL